MSEKEFKGKKWNFDLMCDIYLLIWFQVNQSEDGHLLSSLWLAAVEANSSNFDF